MAHYLINLSFRAESEHQAESLHANLRDLVGRLEASGEISGWDTDLALEWLAVPQSTKPLPLAAAANRKLTFGPPENDDD